MRQPRQRRSTSLVQPTAAESRHRRVRRMLEWLADRDHVFGHLLAAKLRRRSERRQNELMRQEADREEVAVVIVPGVAVLWPKARHLCSAREERLDLRNENQRVARRMFDEVNMVNDRPRPPKVRTAADIVALQQRGAEQQRAAIRDDPL